jgi:multidrug efflux pump subunit AcrA (membrane-fusion protein)
MTAQTRIVVEKIRAAVSVPLECVFEKDERQIVYVQRGTDFVPVEVELGPRNDERVVIKKGLKGGDEVALRDVGQRGEQAAGVQKPAPEAGKPAGRKAGKRPAGTPIAPVGVAR